MVKCPYCNGEAKLVPSSRVYPDNPRDFGMFWYCDNDGGHEPAWVGCHKNQKTHNPLGSLANAKLRHARSRVHAKFDPLWQSGERTRSNAYRSLAKAMGMDYHRCHIAWFTLEQCDRALAVIQYL